MSADNGIYILQSPVEGVKDTFEYRVKDCQAIDNIYENFTSLIINDGVEYKLHLLYEVMLFGESIVYSRKEDAMIVASKLEDAYHVNELPLEYGIKTIRRQHPFPKIERNKVKELINQFYLTMR